MSWCGWRRAVATVLLLAAAGLAGCSAADSNGVDVKVADSTAGLDTGECVPDCDGKFCGDDGCGGSCGECTADDGNFCTDTACQAGSCVYVPNDNECAGGEGKCHAGECCMPVCLNPDGSPKCGDDGCGGSCEDCGCGFACVDGLGIEGDACLYIECGDDGCGGNCGECTMFDNSFCNPAGLCDCSRECAGKVCGADGCGGSCGVCECGFVCQTGNCIATDDPCEGRECGSDGCGGSCGNCPDGLDCTMEGLCEQCNPKCAGKECGSDGCGGSCGECDGLETCSN